MAASPRPPSWANKIEYSAQAFSERPPYQWTVDGFEFLA